MNKEPKMNNPNPSGCCEPLLPCCGAPCELVATIEVGNAGCCLDGASANLVCQETITPTWVGDVTDDCDENLQIFLTCDNDLWGVTIAGGIGNLVIEDYTVSVECEPLKLVIEGTLQCRIFPEDPDCENCTDESITITIEE
jgi:hypothetical protein